MASPCARGGGWQAAAGNISGEGMQGYTEVAEVGSMAAPRRVLSVAAVREPGPTAGCTRIELVRVYVQLPLRGRQPFKNR